MLRSVICFFVDFLDIAACVQNDSYSRTDRYILLLQKFREELLEDADYVACVVEELLVKKDLERILFLNAYKEYFKLPNLFSSEFSEFMKENS